MNRIGNTDIECEYEFSGIGHIISVRATKNKLEIEVTNGLTNEVWQADFDDSCKFVHFANNGFIRNILVIETMTKKTGNYKQFQVFVSMLKSAVSKVFLPCFSIFLNF